MPRDTDASDDVTGIAEFIIGRAFARHPTDCGSTRGSHLDECTAGAAATFDQAGTDFEEAWAIFLSNRTEAGFQKWRHQRKYAMWAAREKPP